MPKAQVFPVPVGALAMISRPAIITGMAFSCTSVIWVKPMASTARRISGDTPVSSLNSILSSSFLSLLVAIQHQYSTFPGE